MDCQHGHRYYKPKESTSKKPRSCLQGTRKIGCTAQITIRQYILYPEYAISSETLKSKQQERRAKNSQLVSLRADLLSKKFVKKKIMYYVLLPTEEAHHKAHPTRGPHIMAQKVNPNVALKIAELVQDGMTDPYEVRRALKHYVNEVMCANSSKPDPDDRAYFPIIRDLRNHIYKAKKALDLSKFDQENLKLKIESWEKNDQKSKFYFRPYIDEASDIADEQHQDKQTLLWVHQFGWQREILAKYGNTMALMDATYKTMKYDMPLFFLTVRTNVGYTVVAEFIVQTESGVCIQEALSILKNWNPDWNPKYFMCDYSEAEILSLETIFPSTMVYICDFHREQSWERWVKDHKHGLTQLEGSQLLDLLRNCALAPPTRSQDLAQESNYNSAVENLKASQVWLQHEQVQSWLNNYWIPIAKRWARAYRDQTFHECINTNNGTESLNKALKYTYLPQAKRSTNLSGIVGTLIDTFLPALRQKYLFSNFEQSSANRTYKESVPAYLHDRPKAVIQHCLDRKASSCKFDAEDVSITTSEGVFEVKSGSNMYTIDFQVPSCSCPDWANTNYPCKHFFAIFHVYPSWGWYLESPRLQLDSQSVEGYFHGTTEQDSGLATLNNENNNPDDTTVHDYSVTIPSRKSEAKQLKEESTNARITLKAIENLTYTCTDVQQLQSLNSELQSVFNRFRECLPKAEGLVILPAIRKRVRQSDVLQRSKKLSSLPLYRRGRKKMDSKYRNRVGKRADALRKVARKYLAEGKIKAHTRVPMEPHLKKADTVVTTNQHLADEITTDSTMEHTLSQLSAKSVTGRKRSRCGVCAGCKAEDCKVCSMCLDKTKYGGPGKKKQCCIHRKCLGLQSQPKASHVQSQPKASHVHQLVKNLHTATISLLGTEDSGISSFTSSSTDPMTKNEMLLAINKPNSKYVKLPGVSIPDELPVNQPTPMRIRNHKEASTFLESYNRKILPILGDGNCLFRALSQIIFQAEDYHEQIRKVLIEFTTLNRDVFSKYCKEQSIEEHVAHMKYETVWGTDIEIRAMASYLKRPIYVCTQKSKSLEYYWDCFNPLEVTAPMTGDYFSILPHSKYLPSHLEICHSNRCHYDVITEIDGSLASSVPTFSTTICHVDLTK